MSTKLFLFTLCHLNVWLLATSDPIIELHTGTILGREAVTIVNNTFYAFEGIPYGEPPIGPLRFKAPQPRQNWEGTLNTTSYQTNCFQTDMNTDYENEDCLHLNVYTPRLPENDDGAPLPVMFFLYGGGFIYGTLQGYPPDLFVDNGVILVTINYRVGVFGFLSTQDEIIPGNAGLKDQQLALKWTHDNIHLFAGDPNKITIFGQSAGSASVTYQLLNQENSGLIQGAILESGTFLAPSAFQRNARKIAFATGAFLNPDFENSDDSQALLEFLQSVDAGDLDSAASTYHGTVGSDNSDFFQGFIYAPVIEAKNSEAFITRKMYGMLNAGNIIAVPTLMGINSEEAISMFISADSLKSQMQIFDDHLEYYVPHDMQISDNNNRIKMGSAIRDLYSGGQPLADNLGNAIRYCSDDILTRSIIKYAELYSKVAKTYFYQFSYQGPMGLLGDYYDHDDGAESVGHAEEILYLFCSYCDDSSYPENDRITRQRLIKLWTNFAKYQDPTPEPLELLQNISFPVVDTENGDFYYLDINENLEIKNHPKESTYQGWTQFYESLDYSDFDTY